MQQVVSPVYISTKKNQNNPKGTGELREQTWNQIQTQEGEIIPKGRKPTLSFLYVTRLVMFYISTKYHKNIPKDIWLKEQTRNQCIITVKYNKGRECQKARKAELSFLYAILCLVLFYISTKYPQNIPKGICVTEWTLNQFHKQNKGR